MSIGATANTQAAGRVSRASLAVNPAVWLLYASMFGIFAIGVLGMAFLVPGLSQARCLVFAAALAMVSLAAFSSDPPALGTRRNHAVVASVYVFVTIGIVALQPYGLIPLPAALFLAPLAAVRLRSHVHIGAHCVGGGIVLTTPAALGLLDAPATLAVFALIPAIWLVAFYVVNVLDTAEAQGAELDYMARRDPLTGVGNRRLLDEQLTAELERHEQSGDSLSVIALDLNGFRALNDAVGHGAGDVVLQEVAAALQATARPLDTVVRQGGDEFCLLLPDTTEEQARFAAVSLRTRLSRLADGALPITTGVGIATFPQDGSTDAALLEVADARLAADKATSAVPDARRDDPAALVPVMATAPQRVSNPAGMIARISRHDLIRDPHLWFATGLIFAAMAILSAGCALLIAEVPSWAVMVPVFTAATAAMIFLTKQAPAMDSVVNHALLAAVYLSTVAFMAGFPSVAVAGLSMTLCVGPLLAVRLVDRRPILAHLSVATIGFGSLIVFGLVGLEASLSFLIMVPSLWGLCLICVVVLETAEAEGEELEQLVRRDPLTGAGNRRKLTEQLDYELALHSRTRQPLSVLALDLNGFKSLNDTFGHAAGDQLLCDVARSIEQSVASEATVVRQGGDEFCVLLPNTTSDGALETADAIREHLKGIDAHGLTITTGIGVASYPLDATTGEELLEFADHFLRASKDMERARLRRGAESRAA